MFSRRPWPPSWPPDFGRQGSARPSRIVTNRHESSRIVTNRHFAPAFFAAGAGEAGEAGDAGAGEAGEAGEGGDAGDAAGAAGGANDFRKVSRLSVCSCSFFLI